VCRKLDRQMASRLSVVHRAAVEPVEQSGPE
jgi:hypothetical protein